MTVLSVISERLNGPLIAQVATLWIREGDTVLDVTYGKGNFWTVYRPGILVAHDLELDGVDFRSLPEPDASIDVVVFDPPYIPQGGRESSTVPDFIDRYGLREGPRSQLDLEAMNGAGIQEAARVLKPNGRLLVKCADYVNGGQFRMGRHAMVMAALAAGLVQVDEFVHHSGTGPQPKTNRDGSSRGQFHSRRAHSFLCVFQAPARRDQERWTPSLFDLVEAEAS